MNCIATADFFSAEVWTAAGLGRYHVFFVIRLATREVKIAGIVPEPHGGWMKQCLDHMILIGEGSLRRALAEFVLHYHAENTRG